MKNINTKYLKYLYIFLVLSFLPQMIFAKKLYEYGFENFTGDRHTTENFPFSSTYPEYCQIHDNATEVVTDYKDWEPHSGNYFFLRNDGSYPLDPMVDGITAGTVNAHGNIGLNGSSCSTNSLKNKDISTGEIFISFWARFNKGFSTIQNGGRSKWIRVYSDGGIYGTVYMHLSTKSLSPSMYFYCGDEGGWLGGAIRLPNAYNGNWHKFSFYINYNNGTVRGWYDVPNENASNTTKEWTAPDGKFGSATRPEHFVIQGNFSAKSPTEITYHALDDLIIWDSMPTSPTSSTKADVDLSGSIDTLDALLTLRNSLGLDMTATTWKASATGDVNCDGISNSDDVRLILRDSLNLDMSDTEWCVK